MKCFVYHHLCFPPVRGEFNLTMFFSFFPLAFRIKDLKFYPDSSDSYFAMSVDITAPKDSREAVVALPAHQEPYGKDCPVERDLQSIFFHHGVRKADVDVVIAEGFITIQACQYVNPDGDADAKQTFDEYVKKKITPGFWVQPIKKAIRRALLPDPFASIVPTLPPPSSKRQRPDDNASSSSSTSTKKPRKTSSKGADASESSSSKDVDASESKSSDEDDEDGAGDGDKSTGSNNVSGAIFASGVASGVDLLEMPLIPGTSSKMKDLNSLFASVADEVSVKCIFITL